MCNARRATAVGVLFALAAGCAPLSGTRPAAVVPPPLGQVKPAAADPHPNGAIVPTGGNQPADPGGPSKFDPTGQPVGSQSSAAGQPLPPPRPTAGDPHVRTDPTLYGGRLNLGPNEMPADRVLELTRQLEAVAAQNRGLVGRIRELEALGVAREQALVEALREVEAAEIEVAKTRGTLAAQKSEITALQEKIRQLEREDIDTLKLVIAALEKLLSSPRREP